MVGLRDAEGLDARRVGRVRRLRLRPADARGGRLSRRGEPRDAPGRRSPASAAGSSSNGRSRRERRGRCCPIGPADMTVAKMRRPRPLREARRGGSADEGAALRTQGRPLRRGPRRERVLPGRRRRRRPAARSSTSIRPTCPGRAGCASGLGSPGICGSDLATIDGTVDRATSSRSSRSPSCPATRSSPTATTARAGRDRARARLRRSGHLAPLCRRAPRGDLGNCERIAFGAPRAGAADGLLLRHRRRLVDVHGRPRVQLHAVPDDMQRRAAVMIEPTACAVHAVMAHRRPGATGRRARRRHARTLRHRRHSAHAAPAR